MTITAKQLDELEARARDLIGRMHVETDPLLGVSTCDLLHLVAVYRAALAWREARLVPGLAAERETAHALIAALRGES